MKRRILLLIGVLFYLIALATRILFRHFGITEADVVSFITHGIALICLIICTFDDAKS